VSIQSKLIWYCFMKGRAWSRVVNEHWQGGPWGQRGGFWGRSRGQLRCHHQAIHAKGCHLCWWKQIALFAKPSWNPSLLSHSLNSDRLAKI
jgi:hypothetical protein